MLTHELVPDFRSLFSGLGQCFLGMASRFRRSDGAGLLGFFGMCHRGCFGGGAGGEFLFDFSELFVLLESAVELFHSHFTTCNRCRRTSFDTDSTSARIVALVFGTCGSFPRRRSCCLGSISIWTLPCPSLNICCLDSTTMTTSWNGSSLISGGRLAVRPTMTTSSRNLTGCLALRVTAARATGFRPFMLLKMTHRRDVVLSSAHVSPILVLQIIKFRRIVDGTFFFTPFADWPPFLF